MTRVKICGVIRPEHALAAAEAGADFIGLNFWPHTPRCLTVAQAKEIVAALGLGSPLAETPTSEPETRPSDGLEWFRASAAAVERLLARKRPLAVGIFVDAPADEINAVADAVGLDLVQLSGDEPWELCLALNRPAIKVVKVRPSHKAQDVLGSLVAGAAALCMLETYAAELKGGSGLTFDWALARAVGAQVPLLLSGGLRPDNVAQAVRTAHPWGVDVASGVETDGVKDVAKIRAFVREARLASL